MVCLRQDTVLTSSTKSNDKTKNASLGTKECWVEPPLPQFEELDWWPNFPAESRPLAPGKNILVLAVLWTSILAIIILMSISPEGRRNPQFSRDLSLCLNKVRQPSELHNPRTMYLQSKGMLHRTPKNLLIVPLTWQSLSWMRKTLGCVSHIRAVPHHLNCTNATQRTSLPHWFKIFSLYIQSFSVQDIFQGEGKPGRAPYTGGGSQP